MALYGTGTAPKTELLINGVWTDFSSRPRAGQKIVIKRGRANEQGDVTAQTCLATLNNRDGAVSNRNPTSPYYGLIPRNTNLRITAGGGDTYLKVPYSDQNSTPQYVSTTDKAVLDITGDIDIRLDVQPYTWRTGMAGNGSTQGMSFCSKGLVDGNLSWVFYMLGDGTIKFRWYPAGTTASQISAASTIPVPVPSSGRLSIRVTLDVDNGSAGNTVTFYTASTFNGVWTQLGSAVIQSGTTSIFNSSAALLMGGGRDGNARFFSDIPTFGGRLYRGQVYSGIGGTLVADMNATSRSVGDTTWSDGLTTPNTWTLTSDGYTRITSDRVRFVGELSALPQVWDPTGNDATVPITASGIIRRLTQGASQLSSPMYRNFEQYTPSGLWMLEDSSGATQAATPVDGARAATVTATTFGVVDTALPGAASVAQFSDATGKIQFSLPKTTSTGTISWVFYVKLSAVPSTSKTFATLYTSGSAAQIRVAFSATAWDITLLDATGGTLATGSTGYGTTLDPTKTWIGYNLLLQTSGSDMTFSIRWDAISTYGGGVGPTTVTGAKVGAPTGGNISASADTVFNDAKVSSIFLSTSALDLSSDAFRKASSAWINETAGARLVRLAAEQGQQIEVTGVMADSEPMGPQLIDTFMANVYDCARTDGGVLGECRDLLSLSYRTRTALENRADVTLDYSQSHLSDVPLPTEDDQNFTNDVTVSRPNGSSARAQRTEGATSVSDPPAGVGRYTTEVSRNAATDDRLSSIAGWLMLTGSWDDARYPVLPVGMHRAAVQNNATLTAQLMALELGDTATLDNLPTWVTYDSVPELIQGYTDTLDQFLWTINYNATPAGAYAVPVLGSDVNPVRADASTHTTGGTMTTTSTSISLVTPAGSAVWVDSTNYPAEFPFDIKVAGEVMTLTAVSGTSSPQTGTVTRSVNGVVKTHAAGELVRLASPFYVGR